MTTTTERPELSFDEFRKLLLTYQGQLRALHQRQRKNTISEADDTINESAYSATDVSENGDTAAILADMEREFPAEADTSETLRLIEAALDRLDDGSYGKDEVTGEPIPIARLRAIPWATMTVETAERVQR